MTHFHRLNVLVYLAPRCKKSKPSQCPKSPLVLLSSLSPAMANTTPTSNNTDEFMNFVRVELCGSWSFMSASLAQFQVVRDPVFSRLYAPPFLSFLLLLMEPFGLCILKQDTGLHGLVGVHLCVCAQACRGGKWGGWESVCDDLVLAPRHMCL